MKLVLIRWIDAQADLGWKEASEVQVDNPPVYSVGWVTKQTKDAIVLAGDIGLDASNNRRIEIPKGMVQEISEIEVEIKEATMAAKKAKKSAVVRRLTEK